jgi:hypothetical protein
LNIVEQYQTLKSKLRGHYQYYGVRGNFKMLELQFRQWGGVDSGSRRRVTVGTKLAGEGGRFA